MNFDSFSPYVRTAMHSYLEAPYKIRNRIIFDYEVIYIEKGKMNVIMYDKSHICEAGTVIFIPPDTPHILESVDAVNVSQPHIHFDVTYDKLSPEVYVSFKRKEDMSDKEKLMIRKNILNLPSPVLKVSNIERFKDLFFGVIDCFQEKLQLYQLDCKAKMLLLLKFLLIENNNDVSPDTHSVELISTIKNYIDNNFKNNITLEMLEKQFSYNKYHLSRMFKRKYGIAIITYTQNLKLEAAKEYLKRELSITEISDKLNFSSIYSFSRFFKNKTGIAPLEYKMLKNNNAKKTKL